MPVSKLSDEAVHDLAGALRGLPAAMEMLNERIESAVSREEVESRIQRERISHEQQVREQQDQLRQEEAGKRRRIVIWFSIAMVALAAIFGLAVLTNRHSLQILKKATSAPAQRVGADQVNVLVAKEDCINEANLQEVVNAVRAADHKTPVAVFVGDANCQAALAQALQQLQADLNASGFQRSSSTTTTIPILPNQGSAGRPAAGPSTTQGPGTVTTTVSPTPSTTPPSTSPPTTAPPTPPTTTCVTVGQLASVCVRGQGGPLDEVQQVVHSGEVRRS